MIEVKLTHADPSWPWLRQTPRGLGVWGDYRYHYGSEIDAYDYWVVYGNLPHAMTAVCPPERTLFFTAEPPTVVRYSDSFLSQFGAVVACQPDIAHPLIVRQQQAMPWLVGARFESATRSWGAQWSKSYDELTAMPIPEKDLLISCFCSAKAITEGHRARLSFVEKLAERLEGRMDVFGLGKQDIADKWDGLAPYEYSVVIENSSFPDYWTEKLSDALLAGCHVFYWGCPNIGDYFPAGAITPIDIRDVDAAMATISEAIRARAYYRGREAVRKARNLVLDKYNLFPSSIAVFDRLPDASAARPVTLRPMSEFGPKSNRLADRLKGLVRQVRPAAR